MKVYTYEHYHCAECGSHLVEQDVALSPPEAGSKVFWCQNRTCPNFGRAFAVQPAPVEVEEVRLEMTQ